MNKLILASQSPRRSRLLREAGIAHEQRSPPFSDPDQPPTHLSGDDADDFAVSLARQKAMSLASGLGDCSIVLAADTICVDTGGRLVGKPTGRDDARAMLYRFMNTDHRVVSGVALVQAPGPQDAVPRIRSGFADTAVVTFGGLPDDQIESYLATDEWRGKAGGYNLFDRQAAGWPITVAGDPTTVVGLPMQRLVPLLSASLHSDR